MKKILTAIALTIALPAMANAQTASSPAPKASNHASMDCKSMMGHKAGGSHDMATMKYHNMADMKGHDMAGMTKQDHEKMMLSCGKASAMGATSPSAVQPPHKM